MLSPTDLDSLRAATREAMAALSTSADVRHAMAGEPGWDATVWRRLSGELGLPGLMLPEHLGGAGLTLVELATVFEETGAALLCAPFFATAALAVPLLQALGDDALSEHASAIAAGTRTATVVRPGDDAPLCVERTSGGWHLRGTRRYVVDGATADLLLVPATAPDGPGVFAVVRPAAGLEVERLVSLDQTRRLAHLHFDGTPAVRLGPPDASAALAAARPVWASLLAAEQVGGAQRCLDMTVEYARTRIQFSRPIGSFQAVKQRLAEMLIQVESARSAASAAAQAAAAGDADFPAVAAMAALTATEAFAWVSAQTIQLHGGIGFTWEHDAHLYFKRARSAQYLLDPPATHVAAVAAHLEQTVRSAAAAPS
jgi:alkylation response protein AidB-like acyl-CoA dehydrogenase